MTVQLCRPWRRLASVALMLVAAAGSGAQAQELELLHEPSQDAFVSDIDGSASLSGLSESFDPYSGSLTLRMVDVQLPGKAGLDLVIQRYYKSSIWNRVDQVTEEPSSYFYTYHGAAVDWGGGLGGNGWQIHMGKVRNPDGIGSPPEAVQPGTSVQWYNNPVVVMPDGSEHPLYSTGVEGELITADRWLYKQKSSHRWELTLTNGITYVFEMGTNCVAPLPSSSSVGCVGDTCVSTACAGEPSRSCSCSADFPDEIPTYRDMLGTRYAQAVEIRDLHGNKIIIDYDDGTIDKITDTYGRVVDFTYTAGFADVQPGDTTFRAPYLTKIEVKANASTPGTRTWTYSYSSGHYEDEYNMQTYVVHPRVKSLWKVTPPAGGVWTFAYRPSSNAYASGRLALASVTNPSGGKTSYTWKKTDYDVGRETGTVGFLTLASKKVYARNGSLIDTWTYEYSPISGVTDAAVAGRENHACRVSSPGGYSQTSFFHGWSPTFPSNGVDPDLWKVGLLKSQTTQFGGGTSTTTTTWAEGEQLSRDRRISTGWAYIGENARRTLDGLSSVRPETTSTTVTRDGSSWTTTTSGFDTYGNPTLIAESGEVSRSTSLEYWYNTAKHLLTGQVSYRTVTYGTEATPGERGQSWYTDNGLVERTIENASVKYVSEPTKSNGIDIRYTYDSNGRLTKQSLENDDFDRETRYSDYAFGAPRIITIENGSTDIITTRKIGIFGEILSETDGRGSVVKSVYDGLGRLEEKTPPVGHTAYFTYSSDGSRVDAKRASSRSASGYEITYEYDGFGRLTRSSDPQTGDVQTIQYYESGGKKTESFSPGGTWMQTIEYDLLGRPTSLIFADEDTDSSNNPRKTLSYDGSTVTVTDEAGRATIFSYHAFGSPGDRRLASVTDPDSNVWNHLYENRGLLTAIQAPLAVGNRQYVYDHRRLLTSETYPETGAVTFEYSSGGDLARSIKGGVTVSYRYDKVGRRTRIDPPGTAHDVAMIYDGGGLRTDMESPAGGTFEYTYDAAQRLTRKKSTIDGIEFDLAYEYDDFDRLTKITYPSGREVTYGYDSAHRFTSVGTPGAEPDYISDVTYHSTGALDSITSEGGVASSFGYDARGRLDAIDVSSTAAGSLVDLDFEYDPVGNILEWINSRPGGASRSFRYDSLYRLSSAAAPGLWDTRIYTYDALGNRTRMTVGGAPVTYSYDSNGRLTATSDSTSPYIYDAAGRLTSAPWENTEPPPAPAPLLEANKVVELATDADGDGQVSPGDRLEYTLTVRNIGNADATGVELRDPLGAGTNVDGSVTTTQGSVLGAGAEVRVDLGTLAPADHATVVIGVRIEDPIPIGLNHIENQGWVTSNELPDELTDDPSTQARHDPTSISLGEGAALEADMVVRLDTDADADGKVSPGDRLAYTVTIRNIGFAAATQVEFRDTPGVGSFLNGSVTTTQGSVLAQNSAVRVSLGAIAAGGSVTIGFGVRIDNPLSSGQSRIDNQGRVISHELPEELTDDPSTPAGPDPTAIGVNVAPPPPPPPPPPSPSDLKVRFPFGGVRKAAGALATDGWAVARHGVTSLRLVGPRRAQDVLYGYPRPDVCEGMEETFGFTDPNCPFVGFSIALDTQTLHTERPIPWFANHAFSLEVSYDEDGAGTVATQSLAYGLQLFTQIDIQNPTLSIEEAVGGGADGLPNRPTRIRGWAMDDTGVLGLSLRINGINVPSADVLGRPRVLRGAPRPDVCNSSASTDPNCVACSNFDTDSGICSATQPGSSGGVGWEVLVDGSQFDVGESVTMTATATDSHGKSRETSRTFTVVHPLPDVGPGSGQPSALGGTPVLITDGTWLVGSQFDIGGPGVGHFDTTPGNSQGCAAFPQRPDDPGPWDVDMVCGGKFDVVDIAAGEWLGYTVDIPEAGYFDVTGLALGSSVQAARIHFELDGVAVTGPLAPKAVTLDGPYTVFKANDIYLEPRLDGMPRQIRVVFDSAAGLSQWWRMSFTRKAAPPSQAFGGTAPEVPGTISAGRFDTSTKFFGQKIGYRDAGPGNTELNLLRPDEWVDSNGSRITGLEMGEWLQYTVETPNSPTTHLYDVAVRYIGPSPGRDGELNLSVEGASRHRVGIPAGGGLRTGIIYGVAIPAGEVKLRVAPGDTDYTLDTFEVMEPVVCPAVANDDVYSVVHGETLVLHSFGTHPTRNDLPGSGLSELVIVEPPAGEMVIDALGNIVYTPPAELQPTDWFEYSVYSDGDPACADRAWVRIDITPSSLAASFVVTCTGLSCSFDASGSTGVGLDYAWTFGDGTSGVGRTAVHTYDAVGPRTVTLSVTAGESTAAQTRTVAPLVAVPDARAVAFAGTLSEAFSNLSANDLGATPRVIRVFGTPAGTLASTATSFTYTASQCVASDRFFYDVTSQASPTGVTVQDTGTVEVTLQPPAPPQPAPSVSCNAMTCNFSSGVEADGAAWRFGDGSTSTAHNPTHVYAQSGTYVVTLSVADSCGQEVTATVEARVELPPVAVVSAVSCRLNFCTFEGTGSSDDEGIVSYRWDFGDGEMASAPSVSHLYRSPGVTYTAALTVTDQVAQTDTATTTVEPSGSLEAVMLLFAAGNDRTRQVADGPPTAAFEVSCSSLSCTFDASLSIAGLGLVSYAWDFGDGATGTSAVPAIQHAYAQVGSYTVGLTVTDEAQQSGQTAMSFAVNSPPVAVLSADCNGLGCSFDAQGSSDDVGIVSYSWDFGDGASGTTVVPYIDHVYSERLDPTVTLTVFDGAQSDQATLTIQLDELPRPAFTMSCQALRCTFDASGSTDDDGIVAYDWDFGDEVGATDAIAPTAEHVYSREGAYVVTLTVTDTGLQVESTTRLVQPRLRRLRTRALFSILPLLVEVSQGASRTALDAPANDLTCASSPRSSASSFESLAFQRLRATP